MTSTIQIAKYGTIDDLLFRGKNKSYGAYQLRQEYEHRLRRAFFLFMASLTTIAVIVPVYNYLSGNYIDVQNGPIIGGVIHDPTILTTITEELPKTEVKPNTLDVKSTMDVPPVIVDNPPKQDLKTRDDVIQDDGVISSIDNDGPLVSVPSADPVTIGKSDGDIVPPNDFDFSQVVDIPEIDPEFPGDLQRFMANKAEFPLFERDLGITEGKVVVGFIVNEDGSLSNIHIQKGDLDGFNKQALRAVKAMPKWKPGSMHGHNVKVNISLPFNFRIGD